MPRVTEWAVKHFSHRDDIVFGRPESLKVFVSSEMRSGRLGEARIAVAQAIEESGFHHAWYWERDGHAGPFSSRRTCIGHARTSDYLILVLGETLTEITRDEYYAAKEEAATVIIFVPQDCERDEEADAFLQAEAMTVTFGKYVSLADLQGRVLKALQAHAVRALRERQLDRQYLLSNLPSAPSGGFAE